MYSRKTWGGSVDPFILVEFTKPDDLADGDDPLVSLVIFEWEDRDFVGVPSDPSNPSIVSSAHGKEVTVGWT